MAVILSQLPTDVKRDRLTTEVLLSAYVNKLIKINNDNDKWSLISLTNNKGRQLIFPANLKPNFKAET